jgi:hypothetical protein
MDINIIHLTYRRKKFAELSHLLLSKCKFKDFNLTLCSLDFDNGEVHNLANHARSLGLNVSIIAVPSAVDNYMNKITEASNQPYKYSIKLDEDIFMGPQAWDYLFENINLLDNEDNILLTPTLSTGIPSCDDFIEHNLSPEDKQEVYKVFGNTNIPNCWGANYQILRSCLKNNGYITDDFYNNVRNIPHFYKGIHPVRVGLEANDIINKMVIKNIDKFLEKQNYYVSEMTRPYLCNSFFAIKTKLWKDILSDKSLFRDGFDEVAINNYRNRTGKKFLQIPNAFGIHTTYNTLIADIGLGLDFINKFEDDFYESIKSKIITKL